jgi:spermidine/putrescine transport system ATP-binding protein
MGTPVEIYERPTSRFVAEFIGESNFLEGKLTRVSAGQVSVFVPGLDAELTGIPLSPHFSSGQSVTVSIRPEKVQLVDMTGVKTNCFQGRVLNAVYIGSDTHLKIQTGEQILKVWEQNRYSRLDPASFYLEGQKVQLSILPENTLVMEKE